MAHRVFHDASANAWEVWEVRPTMADRRLRVRLADELRNGWLAFQCTADRRRLTPVPTNWESMRDDELLMLLEQSQPVPARVRRAS